MVAAAEETGSARMAAVTGAVSVEEAEGGEEGVSIGEAVDGGSTTLIWLGGAEEDSLMVDVAVEDVKIT